MDWLKYEHDEEKMDGKELVGRLAILDARKVSLAYTTDRLLAMDILRGCFEHFETLVSANHESDRNVSWGQMWRHYLVVFLHHTHFDFRSGIIVEVLSGKYFEYIETYIASMADLNEFLKSIGIEARNEVYLLQIELKQLKEENSILVQSVEEAIKKPMGVEPHIYSDWKMNISTKESK